MAFMRIAWAAKWACRDGTMIIAVAGKPVTRQGTVGSKIIMNEAKSITILRDGKHIELAVPTGLITQLTKNRLQGMTIIRYPLVVDSLLPEAKNLQGVVHKGDTLISMDGHPIQYVSDLFKDSTFEHLKDKKKITAVYVRPGGKDTVQVELTQTEKGGTGIRYKSMEDILGSVQINYTFLQAIPAGIHKSIETLVDYIRNLRLLFTSKEVKVSDNLGSVVSIANIFPSIWDWQSFWTLTAIFSILLAFMNVLPIPALDGGHALFTLAEMISGRKPSDKFIEYAQMAGMVLLFSLMAYALGLDIFRLFK